MKKHIKLNEAQLRNIVAECVKKTLKEFISPVQPATDYEGNDLNYEHLFDDALRVIDEMNDGVTEIRWQDVAQRMGYHLDTLNEEDMELLHDAIEDAMAVPGIEDGAVEINETKGNKKALKEFYHEFDDFDGDPDPDALFYNIRALIERYGWEYENEAQKDEMENTIENIMYEWRSKEYEPKDVAIEAMKRVDSDYFYDEIAPLIGYEDTNSLMERKIKKNMKKQVKLNEARLGKIVAESVKKVLKEMIDDYPTAEFEGQEYTIDDELPQNAKVMVHLRGSFYAIQFYPNHGESLRDCLEQKGCMGDLVEWWMEH